MKVDEIEWYRADQNLKEIGEALPFLGKSFREKFLYQALITYILIRLNDLLQQCSNWGHRVSFSDDLMFANQGLAKVAETDIPSRRINDVTDLVHNFRCCACHTSSERMNASKGRPTYLSWMTIVKNDVLQSLTMGNLNLHFEEHVLRAYQEAAKIVKEHSVCS